MVQDALISPIKEWLVDQALGDSDIVVMFETMCKRLYAAGIPVSRARLLWPTLHPLFEAETVIWDRGIDATLDQFKHQDEETEAWLRSPLKYVVDHDIDVFRRQLDGPNQLLDYDILPELKEQGVTDYLILATTIEELVIRQRKVRNNRGILVTWGSDRPGGFSNDDLRALHEIQRRFAVACKTVIQNRMSRTITTTYLGSRAGNRVLEGQIRRGDGETTRAVVWYSDLRDSTMHAETMEPSAYFDMLNDYFEATAGPVIAEGGEVLDFIGDAVLGIFPFDKSSQLKSAAKAATRALNKTLNLAQSVNQRRESEQLQRFKFGIGLNVGSLMFGNIGIPERLSFSVIGPTVNEVARIESMTKLLQQPVLAASSLAALDPDHWSSVGAHKFEGMLEPVELFSFRN